MKILIPSPHAVYEITDTWALEVPLERADQFVNIQPVGRWDELPKFGAMVKANLHLTMRTQGGAELPVGQWCLQVSGGLGDAGTIPGSSWHLAALCAIQARCLDNTTSPAQADSTPRRIFASGRLTKEGSFEVITELLGKLKAIGRWRQENGPAADILLLPRGQKPEIEVLRREQPSLFDNLQLEFVIDLQDVQKLLRRDLAEPVESPGLGLTTTHPSTLMHAATGLLALFGTGVGLFEVACNLVDMLRGGGDRPPLPLVWWAFWLITSCYGVMICLAQRPHSGPILALIEKVIDGARWLKSATTRDILTFAAAVIDLIYGPRLIRAAGSEGAPRLRDEFKRIHRILLIRPSSSTLFFGALPAAMQGCVWVLSCRYVVEGGIEEAILAGLGLATALSGAMVTLNVVSDWSSVVIARALLRRLLTGPSVTMKGPASATSMAISGRGLTLHLVGLGSLMLALAMPPMLLNPIPTLLAWNFSGSPLGVPWAAAVNTYLVFTDHILLRNILTRGFYIPVFLGAALSAVTGTLPLIITSSLLVTAYMNRALRGAPLRYLSDHLKAMVSTPTRQPAATHAILAVGVLASYALGTTYVPPEPAETWSPVLFTYSRTDVTEVKESQCIRIQETELTQEWYEYIWERAGHIEQSSNDLYDRLGLPKYPSIYVGKGYPVNTLSWCEAARFANLWSIVVGRSPVYIKEGSTMPFHLKGCEADEPVTKDPFATGFRMPTGDEWMTAALYCDKAQTCDPHKANVLNSSGHLMQVAWTAANSDWHVHAVAHPPTLEGYKHPLGLWDMEGNLFEWVDDHYQPAAANRSDGQATSGDFWAIYRVFAENPIAYLASNEGRRFYGGAWVYPVGMAGLTSHAGIHQAVRGDDQGVRYVHPVPCPPR